MPRKFTPRSGDIATALSLLTRVPLPAGRVDPARMAASAWAWPVVGALIGAGSAGVAALALSLGLPAMAAAGLVLAAQMALTGAMHEDGLADTADGLWGGHSRERRLEIMKDSRIGSYGVLALLVGMGLRWTALAALMHAGAPWAALIAAGALSRLPMVSLARRLPQARPGGLSAMTGAPPQPAESWALALSAVVALLLLGLKLILVAIVLALVVGGFALVARAKIGGQTGDILGAAQQMAEITVLLILAAMI